MVVSPRGRKLKQRCAVVGKQRLDQLAQRDVLDSIAGDPE